MLFHTPPRCQGQIVEVSYAQTEDGHVIRRSYDQSDLSSAYEITRQRDEDEGDYWNGTPSYRDWRDMTAAELKRYGLD